MVGQERGFFFHHTKGTHGNEWMHIHMCTNTHTHMYVNTFNYPIHAMQALIPIVENVIALRGISPKPLMACHFLLITPLNVTV